MKLLDVLTIDFASGKCFSQEAELAPSRGKVPLEQSAII
tara:strand:- start:165 stop:281 length:117 start_codon:yes stop_codon:yes gene_type:complete